MTPQIFAAMYVTAQKIREDSWVDRKIVTSATPTVPFSHHSPGFYRLNYAEAARESCLMHHQSEDWVRPLEILMIAAWNDTGDWAKDLIR